ncbi:MAG: hypothetical protein ACXIVQ_05355 [Acidimicrobiales bacterium]
MFEERYVVLGLGKPRSAWFNDLTRWVTSGALPVEFVRCLTIDETRAQLTSGRRWSALIVDASAPGVDRDLIADATSVQCAALVIADARIVRPWTELGAHAVLPADLDQRALISALAEHSRPVGRSDPRNVIDHVDLPPTPWRGTLVAVTGTGGTGASVVSAMLAQGLAGQVRHLGSVVLADMALDADLAVLHDVGDVMPGLPELVDAHRRANPDPEDIRALAHGDVVRGYDLILGLRRHRDWTALRSRAVRAAVDGLRRTYRTVVVDVDADLEGEQDTGSPDIEERNVLARSTITTADVVVVVGRGGTVGIHRLAVLARRLLAHGVPPERLLLVLNRSPRSARQRAESISALRVLIGDDGDRLPDPITVPDRRSLEETIRSGGRWPDAPARALAASIDLVLDAAGGSDTAFDQIPERVRPGSLGVYSDLHGDPA